MARRRPLASILLELSLGLVAVAFSGGADVDAAAWREGRRAFREVGGAGCSECHGQFGANELGQAPVIRGADAARIRASVASMDTMTFLQGVITDAEIEAIAAYLAYLETMQPTIVTRRRSVLAPAEIALPAATHVQLILDNHDRSPCTWTVTAPPAAPTVVAGRTTYAVDWVTGDPGTFAAYCGETPETRVQVRIER